MGRGGAKAVSTLNGMFVFFEWDARICALFFWNRMLELKRNGSNAILTGNDLDGVLKWDDSNRMLVSEWDACLLFEWDAPAEMK